MSQTINSGETFSKMSHAELITFVETSYKKYGLKESDIKLLKDNSQLDGKTVVNLSAEEIKKLTSSQSTRKRILKFVTFVRRPTWTDEIKKTEQEPYFGTLTPDVRALINRLEQAVENGDSDAKKMLEAAFKEHGIKPPPKRANGTDK
eukprot:CAMPEP_0114500012 /NCGR_PEP_ID=MMETSP0109-20121206/7728_1 /TAXON_ID=29199 /ORGANISM="Chlorarachnion reptans, Strain CCCM449" /LENGTH=147 /DNA_ID=CAMNT_0001677627 /DNA_START=123 /DNA_END=566 /DNA_ORIENTATION=+